MPRRRKKYTGWQLVPPVSRKGSPRSSLEQGRWKKKPLDSPAPVLLPTAGETGEQIEKTRCFSSTGPSRHSRRSWRTSVSPRFNGLALSGVRTSWGHPAGSPDRREGKEGWEARGREGKINQQNFFFQLARTNKNHQEAVQRPRCTPCRARWNTAAARALPLSR